MKSTYKTWVTHYTHENLFFKSLINLSNIIHLPFFNFKKNIITKIRYRFQSYAIFHPIFFFWSRFFFSSNLNSYDVVLLWRQDPGNNLIDWNYLVKGYKQRVMIFKNLPISSIHLIYFFLSFHSFIIFIIYFSSILIFFIGDISSEKTFIIKKLEK